MKTYEIKKPKGTFYTDFTFNKGNVYGIFEHDCRVSTIKGGPTELTNDTWINRGPDGNILGFNGNIQETETTLIITVNR